MTKVAVLFNLSYGKFKVVGPDDYIESCDICNEEPTGKKCVYLYNQKLGFDLQICTDCFDKLEWRGSKWHRRLKESMLMWWQACWGVVR